MAQRLRSSSARPCTPSKSGNYPSAGVETQIVIKLINGKEIYNPVMKALPNIPIDESGRIPQQQVGDTAGTEGGEGVGEGEAASQEATDVVSEITVSHLLTNIVILQEFLKEFSALLQIRSSLYGDVSFFPV